MGIKDSQEELVSMLKNNPDFSGVGIGLDDDKNECLIVLLKNNICLPSYVGEYKVLSKVVGTIRTL